MSEEMKTLAGATAVERFADGFRDMYYIIDSTADEFDVAKFSRFFGDKPDILEGSCVTVAPKDEENGEYNIHFLWRLTGAQFTFRIEYFKGTRRHTGNEREPFAEDFMAWFAQFFKSAIVKSHLHARFRFPLSDRSSKFPLPQSTDLADGAELRGISLRLTSNLDGISDVKLSRRKADWHVEVIADRTIDFARFEPFGDVSTLASTVSKFLE